MNKPITGAQIIGKMMRGGEQYAVHTCEGGVSLFPEQRYIIALSKAAIFDEEPLLHFANLDWQYICDKMSKISPVCSRAL